MEKYKNIPFIETDPDTGQFGRKLEDGVYEFYENGKGNEIIRLSDYRYRDISDMVCSFGYELLADFLLDGFYGAMESSKFIIAKCIFETD
jgi:hypothetical protein